MIGARDGGLGSSLGDDVLCAISAVAFPSVVDEYSIVAFEFASNLQSNVGSANLLTTVSSNGVERSAIRSPESS